MIITKRWEQHMEMRTVPASMENLDEVTSFLDALLCGEGCPEDVRRLVGISVEELFTNIASYGYQADGGLVEIGCEIQKTEEVCGKDGEKTVRIRLSDRGMPYDPFSRKDPDIHLPIEERPIGGLGVYMVKKFMDRVSYEWKDGCNVAVIEKTFKAQGPREA